MAKQLYAQQGTTGLYRGLSATALRDIPGFAIYFASYQKIKEIG